MTVIDLAIVALFYGTQVPVGVNLPADVNADGVVDLLDLTAVAQGIDAAGGGVNTHSRATRNPQKHPSNTQKSAETPYQSTEIPKQKHPYQKHPKQKHSLLQEMPSIGQLDIIKG